MTATTDSSKAARRVGPVFRPGDLAQAAIDALEDDNPEREFKVDDRGGYIRVETDEECVIRRETMESVLGRPFQMNELETILSSFSGRIQADEDFIRFYVSASK